MGLVADLVRPAWCEGRQCNSARRPSTVAGFTQVRSSALSDTGLARYTAAPIAIKSIVTIIKMMPENTYTAAVPLEMAGKRLDQVAAELFPAYSRSRIQNWIKSGNLLVNGLPFKPHSKVAGGELLEMQVELEEQGAWQAEDIPIVVVHEDQDILVINKQPGLVVHPAAGNWSGTLLNALIHHDAFLKSVPRAGIVHRLDKDTSGLMVVAKTVEAQNNLVNQLQSRSVTREYRAFVYGRPDATGCVDAPIGRHPTVRTRMAVVAKGGKEAVTRYDVLDSRDKISYLRLKLETGRTHQIRVHMTHIGHPLIGDEVYQNKALLRKAGQNPALEPFVRFPRQALHAYGLALCHPRSGAEMGWTAPLPSDMQALLERLDQWEPER